MPNKKDLKCLSGDELFSFVKAAGLPKYRAEQLLHWIYEKYAEDIQEITELSKPLREDLGRTAYISNLRLVTRQSSRDGTEKYLFALEDNQTIESVLIPEDDRRTLCISSQVGCAMACSFCLTGELGLVRNLKAHEIVDQVISVNRIIRPARVTNIVFMGMGEPLANFDEVVDALWRLTKLLGISKRKITLSTSGLVPKIRELPGRAPDVNLAVSLNATTDKVRDRIMPVNKKYALKMLLDACRAYPLQPQRLITFEYVLIDGVNDTIDDAQRLSRILKNIPCKVNLIPYNPHEGSRLKRPARESVLAFQKVLKDSRMTALIRESRGQDILAACGQLKGNHEKMRNA